MVRAQPDSEYRTVRPPSSRIFSKVFLPSVISLPGTLYRGASGFTFPGNPPAKFRWNTCDLLPPSGQSFTAAYLDRVTAGLGDTAARTLPRATRCESSYMTSRTQNAL